MPFRGIPRTPVPTAAGSVAHMERFTSDGTFVAKSDLVFVTMCGGGGSGDSLVTEGAGGGAEAWIKVPIQVTKGESIPIIVGAGGVTTGGSGADGTDSHFGSYLTARHGFAGISTRGGDGGGNGGRGGATADGEDGPSDGTHIGGGGGGESANTFRGGNAGGFSGGNPESGGTIGPGGGASGLGHGGSSTASTNVQTFPGYGGGGAAISASHAGGGIVIVEWFGEELTTTPVAWDITNLILNNFFYIGAEDTVTTGLTFKPDGTKMYITGDTGKEVNEYDLAVPWNVASATFSDVFSVSAQDTAPRGIAFKPDGTMFFVIGQITTTVYAYDMSTPWDLTTAAITAPLESFDVSTEEATPRGVDFKPDGTKMFVVGINGQEVNEYALSTPWDVTTASATTLFSVASEDTVPLDVRFKSDGTKMFVIGATNDNVYEYALSTAWDISSASFTRSFFIGSYETAPHGLEFQDDGTKVFIVGLDYDNIVAFDLE